MNFFYQHVKPDWRLLRSADVWFRLSAIKLNPYAVLSSSWQPQTAHSHQREVFNTGAQVRSQIRECTAETLINTCSIWCHISALHLPGSETLSSLCFPHVTFTSHLSDGVQQLAVGEEDDTERQNQAEGEQADDVGDVIGRLGSPIHRASGAGTLRPVFAPAQQRRYGPGHRVEPGEADPAQRRAVLSAAGNGGRNHGAVTLIGENGEGNQRHDAWRTGSSEELMSRR